MQPYHQTDTLTLYHGDCLDVMPTLAAGSVDAVICDLPYGITNCRWDSVIPFDAMWHNIKRLVKPRAAVVLFGSQPFTSALVMSNPKWFRYEWVWVKNKGSNFAATRYMPMKEHENILVFGESGCAYYPQRIPRNASGQARAAYGRKSLDRKSEHATSITSILNPVMPPDRVPKSVLPYNVNTGLHPTQKPLALLEYLIKTYTNEGDTVLDFTSGSGTTLHAALATGRNCVGIEQDRGYCDTTVARLEAARLPLLEQTTV